MDLDGDGNVTQSEVREVVGMFMLLASHGANTDPFTAGVDDEGYQGLLGCIWMCVVLIVWHQWRRSRPITSGRQGRPITSGRQGLNRAVAAFHAPPAPVRNSVVVRHALLVLTVSKRHALSQHNATIGAAPPERCAQCVVRARANVLC
jgi:hypothetical protein